MTRPWQQITDPIGDVKDIIFYGGSLMTNRKLIERLAHALSVHHALILAQGVLLQSLRVSKQEYAAAVKKCRPHAAAYKSKILASFLEGARPQSEKALWESLGLGDLWGPSGPENESPKS